MAVLTWDETGSRFYETGVSKGVVYPAVASGANVGTAWNGLISVTETPSGAEPVDLYADNMKYASMMGAENFGAKVEAYTYPDAFSECLGLSAPTPGVYISQQARTSFGMCYRTKLGNDANPELGYKLHLLWGAMAKPSERQYQTVNDKPEASTFSWEVSCVPVNVSGNQPTALMVITSTMVDATKLTALEDKLYGSAAESATLPTPDEVIALITP